MPPGRVACRHVILVSVMTSDHGLLPMRFSLPRLARRLGLTALAILVATAASAADHHVAPLGTVEEGDGSAASPWPSLAAAFASGRLAGGDRLLLQEGEHGPLVIGGQRFAPPLTIASAPGGRAHVDRIKVRDSHGLEIANLDVWPLAPLGVKDLSPGAALVAANPGSSDIVLAGLDIRGGPDAPDAYFNWTLENWQKDWRASGVFLGGPDMILRDSVLSGVSNAISAMGDRDQVINNRIHGFSRDALRGYGTGAVFRGNHIQDCFIVDKSHRDAFQSWTGAGSGDRTAIDRITISDNTIIEWTGPKDHPLRCKLQGIALFRGPYRNWVISNNLIAVSAYHGIALYGGKNSEVVHNTVVQVDGVPGKAPWIMIKDTGDTNGNLIANNAAMTFKIPHNTAIERGNLKIGAPLQELVNVPGRDYRPRSGSALVGAADGAIGAQLDLAGRKRPARPAIGAFEAP